MDGTRKLYVNEKWHRFSERVKQRDGYQCLQCQRREPEVKLQVHHQHYVINKPPWDYPLSDCRTLCKGCHAREHHLVEPDRGWFLIAIDDLGRPDAVCERHGCGHEIRYRHLTYHPNWGYKVVGSTCIQHLTQKDRLLSGEIIKLYKNISQFVHDSEWLQGLTRKGSRYISCQYQHHTIRIYGTEHNHSFQIVLKEKGVRWHEFKAIIPTRNRGLEEVKELAYVVLKGTISKKEEEKVLLRGIYRKIRNTP